MPSSLHARLRSTLTAVFTTAALLLALPSPAGAEQATGTATFEQQVLFRASQDPGYACYRIPAIVRTLKGTLLAFAEGRKDNCGDAGDIDIVVKRSTDDGRTWGPVQVVNDGGVDTHGNPAPIVDRETGRILLAESWNTGRGGGNCPVPCDRTPHLQYSDDDGLTWSAPRDLSAEIMPPQWNSWYATGPVHGIQLTRGGMRAARLRCQHRDVGRQSDQRQPRRADHQRRRGRPLEGRRHRQLADRGRRHLPAETVRGDAHRALGRGDPGQRSRTGRYGPRTPHPGLQRGRRQQLPHPFRALPDLYAPQVQCSTVGFGARVLLACPGDPDRRRTMMIRSSYDGGRTWDSVDRGTVVTRDWSGYSDLVKIDSATVGLMYEGGTVDARDEIRFARFTEDWLTPARGPDPTTRDLAPLARPAAVLGGATQTTGVFGGGALEFDGVDDAVRLPYSNRLPLGTKDFTVALWFRTTATTGDRPLLWMGGVGSTQPQVWLRAEPASNRVRGLITVRDGASAVRTTSATSVGTYNDGQWHFAALRRGGGQFTLFVDGTAVSVADVAGSVSRNSVFGVHIGQRVDSLQHFSGAIDDVRVWERALGTAELSKASMTATVDPATATGSTVLWLPLDQVNASRSAG